MRKPILDGMSVRHLLLLVFTLIVLPLSGTSIHALFTLERLVEDSREATYDAIRLTEDVQRLSGRTIAMERSARQYLILNDQTFEALYEDAWKDAQELLGSLSVALPGMAPKAFEQWRNESTAAWGILQHHSQYLPATNAANLSQIFSRLAQINNQLAAESKNEVERQNQRLLADLKQRQNVLAWMVISMVLLAAGLASVFGIWLSRSLAQIESAIGDLGKNRLDQPIEVKGPADLRQLGLQLNWLRQRLGDLENDKARFLRHISHELKTPLAALSEGVALLGEEVVGGLTQRQHEVVRILRQNTSALHGQIEDLLRYNAAAFDVQHLKLQPVDLEALLHQVIDSQRLQWQARSLCVKLAGSAKPVMADSDKFSIVFGNLLSNAIRFSPDGGTIQFTLSDGHEHVHIDCADEGPGVATADVTRIFEPFYQGIHQPAGARRGSGIGLSIVREYVEAHRGTVQLLPSERGAHFRIELANEN
ncbi:sensor histidine kinase [Noviherbaspirillum massiliense]|uniref:sensor histidine kinase n=1 Tax=Noviherbaspirillum massiliense TaxID=1465823 RepID=UPI00030B6DEC|nr:HAMP domain-containing sensor histidine kinase [Noviherbaspirillum massiliense]